MTTAQIAGLLEPKNQNLPSLKLQDNAKNLPLIYVPVVEGEEKKLVGHYKFIGKEKVSGKRGETTQIVHNNQIYYFTGVGNAKQINSRTMRRFFGGSYLRGIGNKPKTIGMACPLEWISEAAVGVHVAALNPKIRKDKKEVIPQVILFNKRFSATSGSASGGKAKSSAAKKALKAGMILAESKNMMRILGAMAPNDLNPKTYADLVMTLARKWKAWLPSGMLKCERISKSKLKKYELLNAVSQGSVHDSELLVFTLHPKSGKTKKATTFIGKGICYDSGGLQSKGGHMKAMKEDMAGSASVLATVYNLAKGNLAIKETTYFVMALAENMMGQNAMKADDIYRTGDGQTVEIIHTDAEGRLVLADAICYVKNNFKTVKRYYTIATLTGSCIGALGDVYTGMVCNDEKLTLRVVKAGKESGDYVHYGPWDMEYDDNNSAYADAGNLGENVRDAGWIKAGLFLHRFIPKKKNGDPDAEFCHFDIAGSIDMEEKGKPWRRKGYSSGVGVALLTKLLTK